MTPVRLFAHSFVCCAVLRCSLTRGKLRSSTACILAVNENTRNRFKIAGVTGRQDDQIRVRKPHINIGTIDHVDHMMASKPHINIGTIDHVDHMMASKPHINIGTIDHVDHGKTTLTAAVTAVFNRNFII